MRFIAAALLVFGMCTVASAHWFLETYDRNGDGYVTLREYSGPAKQFHILDVNGDGLISGSELPGPNTILAVATVRVPAAAVRYVPRRPVIKSTYRAGRRWVWRHGRWVVRHAR